MEKKINTKDDIKIYSYNELFELIKIQQEKEKENEMKKKPSQMDELISEGLRALNNPTSQNFKRTIGILTKTNIETNPDNRLNYIYIAPQKNYN